MKLHTYAMGKVSAVVLDQHKHIHHHATDTTDELWHWLKEQDEHADEETAFFLGREQWEQIVAKLHRRGTVHVETEFDCDLVITRHLR